MIKTAIIGATGYTGSELVRLLFQHPEVELSAITSESRKGERFSNVHPQFTGVVDLELQSVEEFGRHQIDVAFLALPHGVSMSYVKKFQNENFKIIDLSGDYRLSSPKVYEHWYRKNHIHPAGFNQAVYGLPELHKEAIRKSRLVANPGCYPTCSILALAPLMKDQFISMNDIIIDAKSGTTGAGVKATSTTHFSSVNDNFKSYGLKTHRHTIEIEEQLAGVAAEPVQVQFTPHLLPVDRGILSTLYARPINIATDHKQLQRMYAEFYADHPFVRVRDTPPSLKDVRGTNFCDIYPTYDSRTSRILVISVIDNLIKGAAGQAIQNLNLMCGLPETMGLKAVALNP